jgi:hypothetical protein
VKEVNDLNNGIYSAMNLGVLNSIGDYLLFLNAGDEIMSADLLHKSLKKLATSKPAWAISGVKLPWNNQYKPFKGMDFKFRLQKPNSYISHQSVYVRRNIFNLYGGFDLRYPIAADTKLIFQLSIDHKPFILDEILVNVEKGNNVTLNNRSSRLEVLKIINTNGSIFDKIIANSNFILREFKFLIKKISKLLS